MSFIRFLYGRDRSGKMIFGEITVEMEGDADHGSQERMQL